MKKFISIAMVGLMLAFGSVAANAADFNYVEGGYTYQNIDDLSSAAWNVEGAKTVGDNLFVVGSYTNGINADYQAGTVGLGLGLRTSVSETADIYGQIEATTVVANRQDSSKYGARAEAGVRWSVSDDWEVRGGLRVLDLRDDNASTEWRGFAGVEYALTDFVKLGVEAAGKSGVATGQATVRLYF